MFCILNIYFKRIKNNFHVSRNVYYGPSIIGETGNDNIEVTGVLVSRPSTCWFCLAVVFEWKGTHLQL